MIYCLRDPKGKLIESTTSPSVADCWVNGFGFLCEQVEGFQDKYWNHFGASIKAAEKLGYQIVKCKLVVVKK